MGISIRRFIVGEKDALFRLANTRFMAMLRDAQHHRLPRLAGQRVRAAHAIVELERRKPLRVVRLTYDMLAFDDQGRFEHATFERQHSARAEAALTESDHTGKIVDASSRFVAQGGRWTPSRPLARAIENAALGVTRCPRL